MGCGSAKASKNKVAPKDAVPTIICKAPSASPTCKVSDEPIHVSSQSSKARFSASSRSSRASKVLEECNDHHRTHSKILTDPEHANLTDGSPLLEHFRRVFEAIGGDDGVGTGVTPHKLEVACLAFAKTLPEAMAARVSIVISEVFEAVDVSQTGAIDWPDFVRWLRNRKVHNVETDEAIAELFEFCDTDGSGHIHAQNFMDVLFMMSELRGKDSGRWEELSAETIEAIVRDLDSDGDGGLDLVEFAEVVRSARALRLSDPSAVAGSFPKRSTGLPQPHLLLNFDVNNTIVMLDSATGADSRKLLSLVVSNSAWGTVEHDASGMPIRWSLQHPTVSISAPAPNLKTYTEFVVLSHPEKRGPDGNVSKKDDELVKEQRRNCLWHFTAPGAPGESLLPELEKMLDALLLPEEVRGTQKALDAGLSGDAMQLLPSFLHLLRELKRAKRSFTLMFRTFGRDLQQIQQELNALCEGRHPLFPEDDPIRLDGSDGEPDYRMYLDSPIGCGSFFRDPPRDDYLALVMGTTEQPPSREEGVDFLNKLDGVEVVTGVEAVAAKYAELGELRGTVALRDFYQGWAAVGSKSHGGKPLFLSCLNDPTRHCIFFDDHITAVDPKIVDPINIRHWPRRFGCSQLFGVHLVQAQPHESILNRDYFLDQVLACETAREAKLRRWELVQHLLGDVAGVQQVLSAFVQGTAAQPRPSSGIHAEYRPWRDQKVVKNSQSVDTFFCDDEAPSG